MNVTSYQADTEKDILGNAQLILGNISAMS